LMHEACILSQLTAHVIDKLATLREL
jgi:hypothetical protein